MSKMARIWAGQCRRVFTAAVIGLVFTACTPAPEKTNGRVASGAAPASATPSVVPTTSANPSPSPTLTPSAPKFAILSPAATSTDLAPTITWSEAPGASDYTLTIGVDATCTQPVQSYASIVNHQQALQTLAKGVWYVCLNAIVATQSVPATNSGYKMTLTGHSPTLAYVSNTNLNNFQGAGTQASPYSFTVPQTASASLVLTAADLDPGDLPVIVCHNLPSWGVLGNSGTEVDFNTVGTAIGPAVAFTCNASDGSLTSSPIYFSASITPTFSITAPTAPSDSHATVTWTALAGAKSYKLVVSSTADCGTIIVTYANISGTSQTTGALTKGAYFACVTGNLSSGSLVASNNAYPFSIANHAPVLTETAQYGLTAWSGLGSQSTPYQFIMKANDAAATVILNVDDADTGDKKTLSCSPSLSWVTVDSAGARLTITPSNSVAGTTSFTCKANDGTVDSGLIYFTATISPAFNVTGPTGTAANDTPTVQWEAVPAASSFKVVVATDSACATPVQTITNAMGTSQVLAMVYRGTKYVCVYAKIGGIYVGAQNNGSSSFTAPDHPPVWTSTLLDQWTVNLAAMALPLAATDVDPTDTPVYSLDTPDTCHTLVTWQAPGLRVIGNQILGTPTSATDVTTCHMAIKAISGGAPLYQAFNLTIYPPLPSGFNCDTGSIDATCNVATVQTITTNAAVIAGWGSIVVQSGGKIAAPAGNLLSIKMKGDVDIQNGGSVTANLSLLSAANLTVDAGGSLNADGLGFLGAIGDGAGPGGGQGNGFVGSGGSHGGLGGSGDSGLTAYPVYGSSTQPVTLGSGGAGDTASTRGGNGGGAIKLNITGTATINGLLSASGIGGGTARKAGGGAGGSLWINAATLLGSGSLRAAGGDGGFGVFSAEGGGGGGGGRLAVYATNSRFGGLVSVAPGTVYVTSIAASTYGTYYTVVANPCDSGTLSDSCTISSPRSIGTDASLAGTGDLVIASGGSLQSIIPATSIAIDMGGNLTVQSGGAINANLELAGTAATAANVTVESGAKISASGLGYQGGPTWNDGAGPGRSSTGPDGCSASGGAAYGGAGGQNGVGSGASTTTYGSAAMPVDYGSGAGDVATGLASLSYASSGGNGGGALRLKVTGTLTIAGTISADGTPGTSIASAGSGGSVWLSANSIIGNGSITAVGGSPLTSSPSMFCGTPDSAGPGGGGGGRIDLDFTTNSFSGSIAKTGGIPAAVTGGAPTGQPGATGSLCLNGAGCT